MVDIVALLRFAQEQGASDLHLSAGMPPILRINGQMVHINMPPLSVDDALVGIRSVMTDPQRMNYEINHDLDFALEVAGVARFRANAYMQHRGAAAVFRVVPNR